MRTLKILENRQKTLKKDQGNSQEKKNREYPQKINLQGCAALRWEACFFSPRVAACLVWKSCKQCGRLLISLLSRSTAATAALFGVKIPQGSYPAEVLAWPPLVATAAEPRSEKTFYFLQIDEGQITHLICARLKYDLYDFFRGCFLGLFYKKRTGSRPKTPPKKVI